MVEFTVGRQSRIKTIAIRVKNRDKMIEFYRDMIGFSLKREENELAIFGTIDQPNELLWLEESPRAEDFLGEIKKLQRLRLVVSDTEAAEILKRLNDQEYALEYVTYEQAWGILVADPEGNPLEIYYEATEAAPEELATQATGTFAGLTEPAHFGKVHLHASNLNEEVLFFDEYLKLADFAAADGTSEASFEVELTEAHGGTIDLETHKVLGLDFFKVSVTNQELEALENRLEAKKQSFYYDKKKGILTIYDAIGLEWWFVADAAN